MLSKKSRLGEWGIPSRICIKALLCYKVIKKCLSNEATFKQRGEGSKGVNHMGEKQPRKIIQQVLMS